MNRSRTVAVSDFPMGFVEIPRQTKDLRDITIGSWTVLGHLGRLRDATWWLCRCRCGIEVPVRSQTLREGGSQSCGCERQRRLWIKRGGHRRSRTKEYCAWMNAIKRCHDRSNKAYLNYGGRGIRVCERWQVSFLDFLVDVGEAPAKELELDRINNDGDYEPDNVRWATRRQNNLNKRNTKRVNFNGAALTYREIGEALGISPEAARSRHRRGALMGPEMVQ